MRVDTTWLALVLIAAGCGRGGGEDVAFDASPGVVQILALDGPEPLLVGSLIRVRGAGLELLGEDAHLEVATDSKSASLPITTGPEDGEAFFELDQAAVDALGLGAHELTVVLRGSDAQSRSYQTRARIADRVEPSLTEVPSGNAHHNELIVIRGGGFVSTREGAMTARFVGTFAPRGGAQVEPMDVKIPVQQAELFARDRAVLTLDTDLGGIGPGHFTGRMKLDVVLRTGATAESAEAPVELEFLLPELFGVDPEEPTLEQFISVRGAGFVGSADHEDESTLLRLRGQFTADGGNPEPFEDQLVLEFVSGSELRGALRAEPRRGRLVSELFQARTGVFEGEAAAIAVRGSDMVEGRSVAFRLRLAPVRQIVVVRFLPGFYTSLSLFGLAAAAGVVEPLVLERMAGIYEPYAVDIRDEAPLDYSENGYTTVEIGGTDPNGVGLFGYDNSPGKDVGNLRLYDSIGGSNAETQSDGYPGYGGVFVESFLYWSQHPDIVGPRPTGAPPPDPLFDELFDPVRRDGPATLTELDGIGDPERVAKVSRALHAFASLVGETTAHELGHSFGLAEPYGSATTFHNLFDGEGCLMDSGSNRPIGERTRQEGFPTTRFCGDEPRYMEDILRKEE